MGRRKRDAPSKLVILRHARGYLMQGWSQLWYARDKYGNVCDSTSENAAKWCCRGALDRACVDLGVTKYGPEGNDCVTILQACIPDAGRLKQDYPSITDYNDLDTTTHADILKMYDDAIWLCANQ